MGKLEFSVVLGWREPFLCMLIGPGGGGGVHAGETEKFDWFTHFGYRWCSINISNPSNFRKFVHVPASYIQNLNAMDG